ncbi:conserved Plasmodium protein, unknown function [Plasmodium relictum]|uniref:CKK domain-containing protein n=1 Tax=Plasmodium relictum TaxID=85471 RepID=A0A1J1H8S6_PLARL|nr:conserved Plasmodium protein, unknown function [Plasmodium relictum]CRH01190.1 conserved Plasmodium protein, unknown function [Plasmodium relictum]
MSENDKNKEVLMNRSHVSKKYLSKNEKDTDLAFHIDYETLLKNCKHKEKYIDLNLEINYNLEEIMENKDNIKKCIHVHDIIDDENLYRKKSNEDNIKNNKYYYDNNLYFDINNKISPLYYEREKENKDTTNKNLHYENNYNDENSSSYSNDSYCSDITVNSSEEKKKSMNFSQRITYDNNELIHNLNLYNKIINYNIHNKKYEESSNNFSQMNKQKIENLDCYNSFFIKKSNNEKHSCHREKQKKIYSHDFCHNTINKKEMNSSFYLPNESKYTFNENNVDNSPTNLKFFKSSKSLNSIKMEEEILNKYEKILKVIKYLRKIKTKYPEIETIVSILSNHIKNITFKCEKMFDTRSQLNDFLKKIYIYQIFLLKKVVFKDQNIVKNNDSSKYHRNNAPRNRIRFISTDQQNLRDYSIVLEDSNKNIYSMLHHLDKNGSFNIQNKNIFEYIKTHDDKKLDKKDGIYRKRYENNYKGEYEDHEHEVLESKKEKLINRGDEEEMKDYIYSEYKKSTNIYNECQIEDENAKNIYEDVIKVNTNKYKYKNIYNNHEIDQKEKEKEKGYYHDCFMKDKYNEDNKYIYEIEENTKDKKKKVKKKNENILDVDHVLNKVIIQQKTENFTKLNEKDASHTKTLFEKLEQSNENCENKKNFININSNEYESNNPEIKDLYKNRNGKFFKHSAYKERDKLNLNALNLENNNPSFINRSSNEKDKKKSIDKEEKKTHILYYDINKELTAISNRESVIHALKYTLLDKPKNFTVLQNFLFKIDVELVEYKNFILLIAKDIREPHLEALYGLNDFSVFEKVYGKKVAPRFLVSSKVKIFYKYDKFYKRFKELTNVRDFSGITDAVQLI